MIRISTDACVRVFFNVFQKHVVSQKFLHNGFRILQYETRTQMMTSDYFKSRTRGFQRRNLFQKVRV
jgi:uncharacterized lipoprotein